MFKLQNLNVIRIIGTDEEKTELIKQGFKEVIEPQPENKVKKTIKKGKE